MEAVTETLSRFKLLTSNQMIAPGKCSGCGKFSNDNFVDMGLEVEFYGVVYLCTSCFGEAARLLGYAKFEYLEQMLRKHDELKDLLDAALRREEVFRNALASINTSAGSIGTPSIDITSVEIDEQSRKPDLTVNEGEQGSNQSSDERGSSDLQRNVSIESLLGGAGLDI